MRDGTRAEALALAVERDELGAFTRHTHVAVEGSGKGPLAGLTFGAKDIYVCATHALLSGPAVERLKSAPITEIVITDSIAAYDAAAASEKLRILTVAPLLAEAIRRIADETSVSSLFD